MSDISLQHNVRSFDHAPVAADDFNAALSSQNIRWPFRSTTGGSRTALKLGLGIGIPAVVGGVIAAIVTPTVLLASSPSSDTTKDGQKRTVPVSP